MLGGAPPAASPAAQRPPQHCLRQQQQQQQRWRRRRQYRRPSRHHRSPRRLPSASPRMVASPAATTPPRRHLLPIRPPLQRTWRDAARATPHGATQRGSTPYGTTPSVKRLPRRLPGSIRSLNPRPLRMGATWRSSARRPAVAHRMPPRSMPPPGHAPTCSHRRRERTSARLRASKPAIRRHRAVACSCLGTQPLYQQRTRLRTTRRGAHRWRRRHLVVGIRQRWEPPVARLASATTLPAGSLPGWLVHGTQQPCEEISLTEAEARADRATPTPPADRRCTCCAPVRAIMVAAMGGALLTLCPAGTRWVVESQPQPPEPPSAPAPAPPRMPHLLRSATTPPRLAHTTPAAHAAAITVPGHRLRRRLPHLHRHHVLRRHRRRCPRHHCRLRRCRRPLVAALHPRRHQLRLPAPPPPWPPHQEPPHCRRQTDRRHRAHLRQSRRRPLHRRRPQVR